MFSYLDTRSFVRRQIWLFSGTDCCTSPEGLRAADFSGSKIHFHLAFKNWHQICKWLLCELLIEALPKSQINDFQREIVLYLPCALTHVLSAKHQPSVLTHPCGSSRSGMAEALVWANSASSIKIRGIETSVGGRWEIESEVLERFRWNESRHCEMYGTVIVYIVSSLPNEHVKLPAQRCLGRGQEQQDSSSVTVAVSPARGTGSQHPLRHYSSHSKEHTALRHNPTCNGHKQHWEKVFSLFHV